MHRAAEAVQSGERCGTHRVGGIHHCHSYQHLYSDAVGFEQAFYANRTTACARKTQSAELARAVQGAADMSWQHSGGFWGYRPP